MDDGTVTTSSLPEGRTPMSPTSLGGGRSERPGGSISTASSVEGWSLDLEAAEAWRREEMLQLPEQNKLPEPSPVTLYPSENEVHRRSVPYVDFVPYHFVRHAPKRKPSDFLPTARILSLAQLEDVKMYEAIKFVRLENLADQLDVSAMESLLSKISSFPNLETLILRNCGLVNVGLISCSRLVYCDLTNNNIRELDSVVEMASKCLHLDSLDLTGNPLLRRAIWKSDGWSLVAILTHLQFLNRQPLTMEHHILAARQYGTQDDQLRLASFLFEDALAQVLENEGLARVGVRESFKPELLMTLDLQSTRIQLFHLGICVNLRSLNLSNNFLTRISTGGLTRCRHLATLDVGDNHIQDQRELEYLQFLPSLQDVVLQGNPVTKTEKYRLVTILYTLQLRGTPTSSGLQVLDGKAVGLQERFVALQAAGGASPGDAALYKWRQSLEGLFGQAAVTKFYSIVGHFNSITLPAIEEIYDEGSEEGESKSDDPKKSTSMVLHLKTWDGPAEKLSEADQDMAASPLSGTRAVDFGSVFKLGRLTHLDVNGAGLQLVDLRGMRALRVVTLRSNDLRGVGVLGLWSLPSLEVLDISNNPRLDLDAVLQDLSLEPGQISGAFKKKAATRSDEVEALDDFALALPPSIPKLSEQHSWLYGPPDDAPLSTLSSALVSLAIAPLSSQFTTESYKRHMKAVLLTLGERHKRLRLLEGRPIPLPARAYVARKAYNLSDAAVLEYSTNLALLTSALVPPASPLSDGVEGSRKAITSYHYNDVAPGKQYEPQRVYNPLYLQRLKLGPEYTPRLASFRNVRIVHLAHNNLDKLEGLGLESLLELEELDVHNNSISTPLEAIGAFLNQFQHLKSVALRKNPSTTPNSTHTTYDAIKARLLASWPRGQEKFSPLKTIDTPVTLHDRLESWKLSGINATDVERARLEAILAERLPEGGSEKQITALNLGSSGLQQFDAALFANLTHLVLRDNGLTPEAVKNMRLEALPHLTVLDLSENNLMLKVPQNLSKVMTAIGILVQLRVLKIAGNYDERDREVVRNHRLLSEEMHTLKAQHQQASAALKAVAARGGQASRTSGVPAQVAEQLRDMAASIDNLAEQATSFSYGARVAVLSFVQNVVRLDIPLRSLDEKPLTAKEMMGAFELHFTRNNPSSGAQYQMFLSEWMEHYTQAGKTIGGSETLRPEVLSKISRPEDKPFLKATGRYHALVVIRDAVGDRECSQIEELRLADKGLTQLPLSAEVFPNLRTLHLHNNKLSTSALLSSGIRDLPLEVLDLSKNELSNRATLGKVLDSIATLREVNVLDNPCYMEDSASDRIKLLAYLPRSHQQGLALQLLNNKPLSVDERVMAAGSTTYRRAGDGESKNNIEKVEGLSEEQCSRLRLALVVEQQGLLQTAVKVQELNLSQQGLDYIGDLPFSLHLQKLRTLNLSRNALRTIDNQGLELLPQLADLDISHNAFASLDAVIPTLQQCGALSMLKLHRSTADGSTERVQSYHTKVFDCMPRIKVLDGLTNPETLSQTQISAATFLNHIARVPANQLDHVNLTARNITQDEFFWVLAALGNLPVRKLALKNNPVCDVPLDEAGHGYRNYTIAVCQDVLEILDGVEVTDEERRTARGLVRNVRNPKLIPPSMWSRGETRRQAAAVLANVFAAHDNEMQEEWEELDSYPGRIRLQEVGVPGSEEQVPLSWGLDAWPPGLRRDRLLADDGATFHEPLNMEESKAGKEADSRISEEHTGSDSETGQPKEQMHSANYGSKEEEEEEDEEENSEQEESEGEAAMPPILITPQIASPSVEDEVKGVEEEPWQPTAEPESVQQAGQGAPDSKQEALEDSKGVEDDVAVPAEEATDAVGVGLEGTPAVEEELAKPSGEAKAAGAEEPLGIKTPHRSLADSEVDTNEYVLVSPKPVKTRKERRQSASVPMSLNLFVKKIFPPGAPCDSEVIVAGDVHHAVHSVEVEEPRNGVLSFLFAFLLWIQFYGLARLLWAQVGNPGAAAAASDLFSGLSQGFQWVWSIALLDFNYTIALAAEEPYPSQYTLRFVFGVAVWLFCLAALGHLEAVCCLHYRSRATIKSLSRIGLSNVALFVIGLGSLFGLAVWADMEVFGASVDDLFHSITSLPSLALLCGGIFLLALVTARCCVQLAYRRRLRRVGTLAGEKSPYLLYHASLLQFNLKTRRAYEAITMGTMMLLFMPILRFCFGAFVPQRDIVLLAAAGCSHFDNDGQLCCLITSPKAPCLGTSGAADFGTLQIISIAVFVVVVSLMFGFVVATSCKRKSRAARIFRILHEAENVFHEEKPLLLDPFADLEALPSNNADMATSPILLNPMGTARQSQARGLRGGSTKRLRFDVANADGSNDLEAKEEAGAFTMAAADPQGRMPVRGNCLIMDDDDESLKPAFTEPANRALLKEGLLTLPHPGSCIQRHFSAKWQSAPPLLLLDLLVFTALVVFITFADVSYKLAFVSGYHVLMLVVVSIAQWHPTRTFFIVNCIFRISLAVCAAMWTLQENGDVQPSTAGLVTFITIVATLGLGLVLLLWFASTSTSRGECCSCAGTRDMTNNISSSSRNRVKSTVWKEGQRAITPPPGLKGYEEHAAMTSPV